MKLKSFFSTLAFAISALSVLPRYSSALPSATGNRILVVLDQNTSEAQSQYSLFFDQLSSRGYNLSFKFAKETKPQLVQYDVKEFDHLILLTPSSKSLASDLSPQALIGYLKDGGNVLFGFDSSVSEGFRDLSREFSVELEERATALVDHFGFDKTFDQGNHTAVLVGAGRNALLDHPHLSSLQPGGIVPNPHVFSQQTIESAKTQPILYRGIAHRLGSNPLAFPLILPPATSYSSETTITVKEETKKEPEQQQQQQPQYTTLTSFSQPSPITTTITKVIDQETTTTIESVITPASVPTVVQVQLPPPPPSKMPKNKISTTNGWVAKGRGSIDPLEQRKELVSGFSHGDTVVSLASAFQLTDNSTRVVFLGSLDLLKDEFFRPSTSLNKAVVNDITSWLFQEKSVVRIVSTKHFRVKSSSTDVREDYEETQDASKMYRIKDNVTYTLSLSSHDPIQGWMAAPETLDLQVSFKMLDPYITTYLQPDVIQLSPFATTFSTTFQIPDRHGVYSFDVDWKRNGWSFVFSKDTAPVRPFNHDEYPRFLSASWPYIAGSFSTVAGFLVFSFLWLMMRDQPLSKIKTK